MLRQTMATNNSKTAATTIWLENLKYLMDTSSTYPIQKLIPRPGERQEPRLAVVEAERRAGKRNADERIIGLVSGDEFGDFLALPGGHGDAVSGIAERVVDAVELAGVGH